ncbi:MAG: GNAT family N-acetyltransferase [Anaerolineales bacterium]|nr:GNAT family N-acetyltransferase [Anaerolineales bacterium]
MTNYTDIIDVTFLQRNELQKYRRDISKIYQEAFALPPYNESERATTRFIAALEHHMLRPGFQCVVAYPSDQCPLVGFAFGYTAQTGQWWHDIVASAMPPSQIDRWLTDCFELAELAVLPPFQGRGIGGRLHDHLLRNLPHKTAALSTLQAESNALHLYRKRGWVTLVKDLVFPGGDRKYMILGLDLKMKEVGI